MCFSDFLLCAEPTPATLRLLLACLGQAWPICLRGMGYCHGNIKAGFNLRRLLCQIKHECVFMGIMNGESFAHLDLTGALDIECREYNEIVFKFSVIFFFPVNLLLRVFWLLFGS